MDPLRPVSTMEPIITKPIWDTEDYPPFPIPLTQRSWSCIDDLNRSYAKINIK
jgi:hypothetical protein